MVVRDKSRHIKGVELFLHMQWGKELFQYVLRAMTKCFGRVICGIRFNVGKDGNGRVLAWRKVLVLCHPEWCELLQCDIQAEHWDYDIPENVWDKKGRVQVQIVRVLSIYALEQG
jgi:hypothetical protein